MSREGGGGCGVSANEYSCAHGAQMKFRDLAPYFTYVVDTPTLSFARLRIYERSETKSVKYCEGENRKRRCVSTIFTSKIIFESETKNYMFFIFFSCSSELARDRPPSYSFRTSLFASVFESQSPNF
jgi:hypothetical protein